MASRKSKTSASSSHAGGKSLPVAEFIIRFPSGSVPDPEFGQLGELMMLMRAVYAAGLGVIGDRIDADPERLAGEIRAHLAGLDSGELSELFIAQMGDRDLRARRITHQSPVEMLVYGVPLLLAAVVALAGGKFKVPLVFAAELPNGLIDALLKLRSLFSKGTRSEVGYGVRNRRIKLSKEEFAELMRHDPAKKDNGGFQRFLIGLQFRVDQTTRELTLSPSEMEWILRQGADPKKGGWQRSIRKIFGRHFDWS